MRKIILTAVATFLFTASILPQQIDEKEVKIKGKVTTEMEVIHAKAMLTLEKGVYHFADGKHYYYAYAESVTARELKALMIITDNQPVIFMY